MVEAMWSSSESQSTIASLYEQRLQSDPSGEYLDIYGTKLTAADVVTGGWRISTVLDDLGLAPQDRVATIAPSGGSYSVNFARRA